MEENLEIEFKILITKNIYKKIINDYKITINISKLIII